MCHAAVDWPSVVSHRAAAIIANISRIRTAQKPETALLLKIGKFVTNQVVFTLEAFVWLRRLFGCQLP